MSFLLFEPKLKSAKWSRSLKKSALIAGVLIPFLSLAAYAAPRRILVCTGADTSPELKSAAEELVAQAANISLFKALTEAGDADGIARQASETLMPDKAFPDAAHNHLVVIGLRSHDPLLDKIWGFTTTIDEQKKQLYAEGWGYLEGDIGWIECDRNPFLHSRKIKNAPEDTIIVKISGTSERGVLAAIRAFEKGQLSGFVAAGPVTHPKKTILDLEPAGADPLPAVLPPKIEIGKDAAFLAGWMQIPAEECRGILDATGIEPKRIWRVKYLPSHVLEETPAIRWMAGVNRRAIGNAVDVIQFESEADAKQAAAKTSAMDAFHYKGKQRIRDEFHEVSGAGQGKMWEVPQATDEVMSEPHWNILITTSGRYMLMSTLPQVATTQVAAVVR